MRSGFRSSLSIALICLFATACSSILNVKSRTGRRVPAATLPVSTTAFDISAFAPLEPATSLVVGDVRDTSSRDRYIQGAATVLDGDLTAGPKVIVVGKRQEGQEGQPLDVAFRISYHPTAEDPSIDVLVPVAVIERAGGPVAQVAKGTIESDGERGGTVSGNVVLGASDVSMMVGLVNPKVNQPSSSSTANADPAPTPPPEVAGGLTGPTGPVGATGADGVAGIMGATGPEGPQGPQGPPGDAANIVGGFALNAGAAMIADAISAHSGSVLSLTGDGGGISILANGHVGIGTSAPGQALSVAGTIESTAGGVKFPDGTTQATAAIPPLAAFGAENGATSSTVFVDSSSNVGIGNADPSVRLDVTGAVRFGVTSATCDASIEGAQRYNATTKRLDFCDGTTWQTTGTPPGAIEAFGGDAIPAGWLLCNGAAVSRATYPDLFTAIASNWGQGDGSTTFNLPDLRGRFPRGVDDAAGRDPDSAGRTAAFAGGHTGNQVGSVQLDELKSHAHSYTFLTYSGPGGGGDPGWGGSSGPAGYGRTTDSTGGTETRPKNANVRFIIKY